MIDHANGAIARNVESAMLRWLRQDHALPQFLGRTDMGSEGGWTETFSEEGPTDEEVVAQIMKTLRTLS